MTPSSPLPAAARATHLFTARCPQEMGKKSEDVEAEEGEEMGR